jgi:aspartate kinase
VSCSQHSSFIEGSAPQVVKRVQRRRLIHAAEEALKPGSHLYVGIVDAIREDHIRAAREYVTEAEVLDVLEKEIEAECGRLARLLGAAQV